MVVGIGIDIVSRARIEKACKNEKFTRRILTEAEEMYCLSPKSQATQYDRIAGRWAAKEAIIKAIGIPFAMNNIEILNDPLGQPHVRIHDVRFDAKRLKIFVSITHDRTHAAGVAVVERSIIQIPV
jgi:holo-[acyl-carrier protein] synthase